MGSLSNSRRQMVSCYPKPTSPRKEFFSMKKKIVSPVGEYIRGKRISPYKIHSKRE